MKNKSKKKIYLGSDYFKKYAGSGKSYNQVWKQFSLYDELFVQFQSPGAPKLKKIAILGTATGKIVPLFEEKLKSKVWGCEINEWAHSQTPKKYLKRVSCENMIDFIERAKKNHIVFDLTFSNSLIYLSTRELSRLLKSLPYCTRYLHFASSLKGKACHDPYRKILKSYKWWNTKLTRSGFVELKSKKGRTFLWISRKVDE